MTETREELEARLADMQRAEQAEAAARAEAEVAQRQAEMDPEQAKRAQLIEEEANAALDRDYPPSWMPHKHSDQPTQIVGLIERIDPRVGPSKTYGTYSAVLEVKCTDGRTWTVWANEQGAMYAQMVRMRLQPGEVIAIRYRGKKESESNPGWSYHDYRMVRVGDDGPSSPVDYEQLAKATETPALPAAGDGPPPDDDIPF